VQQYPQTVEFQIQSDLDILLFSAKSSLHKKCEVTNYQSSISQIKFYVTNDMHKT